jgi:excisionase family DNA binding protein
LDKLLTVKEVAKYLNVDNETILRWIRRKELPAIRIGSRSWRIKEQDLTDYLNR